MATTPGTGGPLPDPERYAAKLLLAGFLDQAEAMRLSPGVHCELLSRGLRRKVGNRGVKVEEFQRVLEGVTSESLRRQLSETGRVSFTYDLPDWCVCRIEITRIPGRYDIVVEYPSAGKGHGGSAGLDAPEGAGSPAPVPTLDPSRNAAAALEIPRTDADGENWSRRKMKRRGA